MKKMLNKECGITLVALVITIILLLILAGISIASLTNSGLFENAKLAKEKSDAAQEKEDATLADYENKIGEYVDGTRQSSSKIKSLINKDDGVYNKTEGGYIFDTPTTETTITSNNVIALTDSIENYDYIIFDSGIYRLASLTYTYPTTMMLSSEMIKSNYSQIFNVNKSMYIVNNYRKLL